MLRANKALRILVINPITMNIRRLPLTHTRFQSKMLLLMVDPSTGEYEVLPIAGFSEQDNEMKANLYNSRIRNLTSADSSKTMLSGYAFRWSEMLDDDFNFQESFLGLRVYKQGNVAMAELKRI